MEKRISALLLAMALLCAPLPASAYGNMGKAGENNIVSVGEYHTGFIDQNGSLWMWGENGTGQLGNGTETDSTTPVKVLDNVAAVSCGCDYTAALKTDDTLWTWGYDDYGQLGNGSTTKSSTPVKVLDNVAAVSGGWYHTAAIKTDGSLWMWGNNGCGELGNGGGGNAEYDYGYYYCAQTIPIKVLDNVAAVSCGGGHTAAVKTDGSLWMWGWNNYGQLGNGTTEGSSTPVRILDNVAAVSCGCYHTAAIKTDGSLWMWGDNEHGQLGSGNSNDHNGDPAQTVPVKVLDNVAVVNCGGVYTAAIKTDGSLWMWGFNGSGELGNGTTALSSTPVKVLNDVAAVSCGSSRTAAIKTDGTLWSWGGNDSGQLGYEGGNKSRTDSWGTYYYQTAPRQVAGLTAKVPAASMAYASTQTVIVDNIPVAFQMYALKDANGNDTNYIKLRDLAYILNGTAARFEVGWNGAVNIEPGKSYTVSGGEMSTPYSGDRVYETASAVTNVNGAPADLEAIILKDDQGGGYTYYKLRDLGDAIGFTVDWSADRGIYIETK